MPRKSEELAPGGSLFKQAGRQIHMLTNDKNQAGIERCAKKDIKDKMQKSRVKVAKLES